jgi:hypothetical protein
VTREFADTSYYLALLGPADRHHCRAVELSRRPATYAVTTEYVLLELGNALARVGDRSLFVAFEAAVRASPTTAVVPASPDLWSRAVALYASRPDKGWSLTDCASFVVMADRRLTDALTADRHFAQAGFAPLLT